MPDILPYAAGAYTAAVAILLGFAAWRDVATRMIPDGVSLMLIAAGMLLRASQGWEFLATSLFTSVAIFLLLMPFCSYGLLGGADLKLLAALAVGLPPQSSLHLILAVTIIGGVLAAIYLLVARLAGTPASAFSASTRGKSSLGRIAAIETWRIRRRASLPYGIAIAIGAAIVVLQQQGV